MYQILHDETSEKLTAHFRQTKPHKRDASAFDYASRAPAPG